MARKGFHQFEAMKRQQARQVRASEKRQRKVARAEARGNGTEESDVDFTAGPQANKADDEEIQRAIDRVLAPGRGVAEERAQSPAKMAAARLFVGNLDRDTDNQGLRELFARHNFNVIEASVVTDRNSGQSRGFAFVQLDSPKAAEHAVATLDGADCDGRAINVRLATSRK